MSAPPQLTESSFKDGVRTYIELHDELTRSSKTLRDMKKKKDELGNAILTFMRDNRIDEFQVGDGKLMRKQSKRTEGACVVVIVLAFDGACSERARRPLQPLRSLQNSRRPASSLPPLSIKKRDDYQFVKGGTGIGRQGRGGLHANERQPQRDGMRIAASHADGQVDGRCVSNLRKAVCKRSHGSGRSVPGRGRFGKR